MFRAKKNSGKTRFTIRRSSGKNTETNHHSIECTRIFSNHTVLVYESNIEKKIPSESPGGIFEGNLTNMSS